MRTLAIGALGVFVLAGCELDTGEDDTQYVGGAAGEGNGGTGGQGGSSGTNAGSGGTSTGGAGGTTAGSGGTGGSTGGSSATGGSQAGSGGTSASGGTGGANGGTGGSTGGSGGNGASGGSTGGSGGGAGMATGGSGGGGECTQNIRCQLDPPPSTGDPHQDCVDRINQFRTECACLPPLERWTEGEACADEMAEYDSVDGEAHAGFRDDICDGGSAQNECPGWNSETQVVSGCLQQMWDEGPPPQDPCDGQCFQEYGHFINMTNERYTRVACGFFTTDGGDVWSVQNFSR